MLVPEQSQLALRSPSVGPARPASLEAQRFELLAQVIAGKLSVQALRERHQLSQEEVQEWLRGFHRVALAAFDEQLRRALVQHGAAPEALGGSEISVSLEEISIIDWIQAILSIAEHAVISVRHDAEESRMWCSKGALIDAESGRLRGEAALYRIAGLDRGHVVTELRRVHRERKIFSSTPGLLLEAARRKDEAALSRLRLGDLEHRFARAQPGAPQRPLEPAEATVLSRFDVPRRLSSVLDDSDLGEVETLHALESLMRMKQLIEVDDGAAPAASASSPGLDLGPRGSGSALPIAFVWQAETGQRHGTWRWLGSTLVMAAAVALAAWVGAARSAPSARPAPPPPAPTQPAVLPLRPAETYAVDVRVYPPDAAIELDGLAVGNGRWLARLTRDGSVHELRVGASGFVPARVLFVDTPPPLQIRLEPLPEHSALAEEDALPGRPERARRKPSAGRKRPYVQIIDGADPDEAAE